MSGYKSSFTRVRGLIGQQRQLAVLLPEAERLRELNRRFARIVSPAVARACQVMAVEGDLAVVHCASGTAAARLRGQASSIARQLSDARLSLAGLKIKVRADWNLPTKPEKSGMNATALDAWSELEDRLPDGELKLAIDHLVRHQRRTR